MASTRTYEEALRRLSQLQSNHAVTNMFSTSPSSSGTGDLNALAIPEMVAWLARAGYTPAGLAASGLRCVHVAGTKGKGSVATLTASVLARYVACRPVGTYTSPHVASVRERILLDGAPLSREAFARYFFEVWDRFTRAAALESSRGDDPDGPATKPFYFRFLTIMALHVFAREGVRDAVVECGIGGEYDATNVLPADAVSAAVITPLGIDHVAMLGDTVGKIAWHKAGIMKPGVRAFTLSVEDDDEVMAVLRARAAEKGAAELVEVRADEVVDAWDGIPDARLQGPFQKRNMALAVAAAREHLVRRGVRFDGAFARDGYPLSAMPDEFRCGLRDAALRGRCESLMDKDADSGVEWFVDGAHTEDSLAGVGQWFASRATATTGGKDDDGGGGGCMRILLYNQQERDPAVLLRALLSASPESAGGAPPLFTHAIFTRNEEQAPGAGEPARDLAVQTKARDAFLSLSVGVGAATFIHDAVRPAVEHVRALAAAAKVDGKACKVLATGSFHLVGAVLRIIDHVED